MEWKKDRIKRTTMKNIFSRGGLQVPDPSAQADSLKVTWIKKFMNENNCSKWKRLLENRFLVEGTTVSVFECKLSKKAIERKFPDKFWKETYVAWQRIVESEVDLEKSILDEVLWLNRKLNLEDKIGVPKKQLCKKGVLRIKDIYNGDERRLMSANELSERYKVRNFLAWHTILKVIPKEWKEEICNTKPTTLRAKLAIYDTLRETTKVAKWAYPLLLGGCKVSCPIKAQTKWENELGDNQISWTPIYKALFSSTRDTKIKWLQFRILHRILPTNKWLNRIGKKDSNKCDSCSEPDEDIYHIFWGCKKSKNFWASLQHKLSLPRNITLNDVILGPATGRGVWAAAPLRMCILLSKQFIWQQRWSSEGLNMDCFSRYVKKYVSVEKCIVARSGGTEKFDEVFGRLSEVLCAA